MAYDIQTKTQTRAIVCESGVLSLRTRNLPELQATDLQINVQALGLCRTDLYAIDGSIETGSNSFVPGHEFAGYIAAIGGCVKDFRVGDRVVIDPLIHCHSCSDCRSSNFHNCVYANFMGVDADGACAEQVVVAQNRAYRISDSITFAEAAFAEPVAATLAVLKSNIKPSQQGLIIGNSRISKLALRVLSAKGFSNVTVACLSESQHLNSSQFDYVIETESTTDSVAEMYRLVRPRGRLVLKSRQHQAIQFVPRDVLAKEPSISIVNYGRFDDAVELLNERKIPVSDLVGKQFSLDDFQNAFETARRNDDYKTFLNLGAGG